MFNETYKFSLQSACSVHIILININKAYELRHSRD